MPAIVVDTMVRVRNNIILSTGKAFKRSEFFMSFEQQWPQDIALRAKLFL